jgi:hypothetical protein
MNIPEFNSPLCLNLQFYWSLFIFKILKLFKILYELIWSENLGHKTLAHYFFIWNASRFFPTTFICLARNTKQKVSVNNPAEKFQKAETTTYIITTYNNIHSGGARQRLKTAPYEARRCGGEGCGSRQRDRPHSAEGDVDRRSRATLHN